MKKTEKIHLEVQNDMTLNSSFTYNNEKRLKNWILYSIFKNRNIFLF